MAALGFAAEDFLTLLAATVATFVGSVFALIPTERIAWRSFWAAVGFGLMVWVFRLVGFPRLPGVLESIAVNFALVVALPVGSWISGWAWGRARRHSAQVEMANHYQEMLEAEFAGVGRLLWLMKPNSSHSQRPVLAKEARADRFFNEWLWGPSHAHVWAIVTPHKTIEWWASDEYRQAYHSLARGGASGAADSI